MPIVKLVKKTAIISSWVCLLKINPDQATFVFCDDSYLNPKPILPRRSALI